MASYKLNEEAEDDVSRLYEYGILNFGLDKADRYYDGLIDHLRRIVTNQDQIAPPSASVSIKL